MLRFRLKFRMLFSWGVRAQPWLILTDKEHVVRAEGFSVDELDDKIEIAMDENRVTDAGLR